MPGDRAALKLCHLIGIGGPTSRVKAGVSPERSLSEQQFSWPYMRGGGAQITGLCQDLHFDCGQRDQSQGMDVCVS